jgi:hypothetical protein
MPFKMFETKVNRENSRGEICECDGSCPGYGTRGNCPPLIVLATIAMSQAAHAGAGLRNLLGACVPAIA